MEFLNNRYALYMLGRGSAPPQTPPLSVNAFCIVTNSAHETPVYRSQLQLSFIVAPLLLRHKVELQQVEDS